MEEHELDGFNIKFEVGAFIPMADSDTDERLRLGIVLPANVVGTCGTGREVGFEITPVEYDCFDKPDAEWWISGSEYRFIGKKVLGVQVKIVNGIVGDGSMESRKGGDRSYAPLVIPKDVGVDTVCYIFSFVFDSPSDD